MTDIKKKILNTFEEGYKKSKSKPYGAEAWGLEKKNESKDIKVKDRSVTGLPVETIKDLGTKITELPKEIKFHRLVEKIFDQRLLSI